MKRTSDSPRRAATLRATLGATVTSLRIAQKKRRETLSGESGLGFSTLGRIERDAVVPNRATVRVLADALGVPAEDLEQLVDREARSKP